MSASDDLYVHYLDREGKGLVDALVVLDGALRAAEVVDQWGGRHFLLHDQRYPWLPVPAGWCPAHELDEPLPADMLAKLRGEVAS